MWSPLFPSLKPQQDGPYSQSQGLASSPGQALFLLHEPRARARPPSLRLSLSPASLSLSPRRYCRHSEAR